jgi:hypothetical protein
MGGLMRRTILRALVIGMLAVAFWTATPVAPVFAGAGTGTHNLRPGECFVELRSEDPLLYNVFVGMGPTNPSTGLASREQLIVKDNPPDACRKGNLGMDPIPFDSDAVAFAG